MRNGPDFHYRIHTKDAYSPQSEPRFVKRVPFANVDLDVPANQSVIVLIEPANQKGVGNASETIIPAVHDQSGKQDAAG